MRQFAFFNEIEGKTPPEHCEKGGPSKAKTKAELLQYLRDSFDYGNRVLATINADNTMMRVEGPHAGPNTRLGMTVTAVWHIADHFGQLVSMLACTASCRRKPSSTLYRYRPARTHSNFFGTIESGSAPVTQRSALQLPEIHGVTVRRTVDRLVGGQNRLRAPAHSLG